MLNLRSHRGIENRCHWSLDVTYCEDESRIRDKYLRASFAWLNRLTLSLLKQNPGRKSLAMKRSNCGWSDDFLFEIRTGAKLSCALALRESLTRGHILDLPFQSGNAAGMLATLVHDMCPADQ
jgi:hypothetical protein